MLPPAALSSSAPGLIAIGMVLQPVPRGPDHGVQCGIDRVPADQPLSLRAIRDQGSGISRAPTPVGAGRV